MAGIGLGTIGTVGGTMVGGPLGGAIGGSIGGAIDANQDRKNAERQRNLEYERQKEFAQHGIQWRVEDARAAGLHPLSVLGSTGASYGSQPITVGGDYGPSGQDIQGAMLATATPADRDRQMEELALVRANRARVEAETIEIYDRMQRNHQERNARPGVPSSEVVTDFSGKKGKLGPLAADAVQIKPAERVSVDPRNQSDIAGGPHPSMQETLWPGGFRILLPYTGQGGIPEDIDASMLPLIVGANIDRYGYRWLIDMLGYVQGVSPASREGRTAETLYRYVQRQFPGGVKRDSPQGQALQYRGMR